MPIYESPGVYAEEPSFGVPSIQGAPTSVTAFVGAAPRGAVNTPVRVTSFAVYEREFAEPGGGDPLWQAVRLFFLNGGAEAIVVRVVRGGDASTPAASAPPTLEDVLGDAALRTGLHALDDATHFPFNLLCLPPLVDGNGEELDARSLWPAAAEYCAARRAMLLVDPPADWTTSATAAAEAKASRSVIVHPANAALYFPRLVVAHPDDPTRTCVLPPSGAIAGLIASTDSARGVWKAPAGADAALRGVQGLTVALADAENDAVNAEGINALRAFPTHGIVVWGARTLASDPEWRYVPVRRLALFLEESIVRGTEWAVFEPNDAPLWAQLRLQVSSFLTSMWRAGALAGTTPERAFFVKCGRDTTAAEELARGIVNVLVGFAPLKPAEFVILRFSQRTLEAPSVTGSADAAPSVLDALGQRLATRESWDDLVLPERTLQSLRGMVDELRHQRTVYDEWGFSPRAGAGRGVTALFAGGSGTGKTLAAEVVAGALGAKLFAIDLTALVSKYIGETEKNLRRIFDAAETRGAVLLFDEAEAIFGKRTDVRDAHDRYANLGVGNLLAQLEQHPGLVILTTNAREDLDQACMRRLSLILDFPFPDAASRRRIWERAFPALAPRESLDFSDLAEAALTGGGIQTAALHAAFLAAARGGPITQELVREGVRAVLARIGRRRGEDEAPR